jgi:hypothetical protein
MISPGGESLVPVMWPNSRSHETDRPRPADRRERMRLHPSRYEARLISESSNRCLSAHSSPSRDQRSSRPPHSSETERLIQAGGVKLSTPAITGPVAPKTAMGRSDGGRRRESTPAPFPSFRRKPESRLCDQAAGSPGNGSSIDGLCGVNSSAPFSVISMSSSRRIPNSPGM